ncbi:endonuclease domain-containing protein [Methylomonas koyamae]|uniref:endonuclease domain-containing protein n=2 Tax=Methylomonas koyamae TaxID=702114 RepID=UPI00210F5289|nr:endonuclease domain-containing protein [Methylomonas koyamae]
MNKYTMQIKSFQIKPLREQLLKEQDGKCALCGFDCEVPCLDHSHFTGRIRGVICRNCNVALGRYENGCVRSGRKDRILDIAKNLSDYLLNERSEIHPVHGKKKRRKARVKNQKSPK